MGNKLKYISTGFLALVLISCKSKSADLSIYSAAPSYNLYVFGGKYSFENPSPGEGVPYFISQNGQDIALSPARDCVYFGNQFAITLSINMISYCRNWKFVRKTEIGKNAHYLGFCQPSPGERGCGRPTLPKQAAIEFEMKRNGDLKYLKFNYGSGKFDKYEFKYGKIINFKDFKIEN